MCGLGGIIGQRSDLKLERMLANITHRGPDGSGRASAEWYSSGMCRLAIRDTAGGSQPFVSSDKRIKVYLNGEIYNYKSLRRFEAGNFLFKTDCDTEVVLAMYTLYGLNGLAQLKGIYVIVVFDGDVMYALRDQFGVKPLYYSVTNNELLYCSEAKGLIKILAKPKFDEATAADVMIQNYSAANATHFSSIKALPPGSLLTVIRGKENEPRIIPFFDHVSIGQDTPDRAVKLSDVTANLQSLLVSAIKDQTEGEARCDFALSGGVDSATLVTLAAKFRPIHAHVVTDATDNQDYLSALSVASCLQIQLEKRRFTYEEYLASLPSAIWIEERPSSLSAAPLQFLAESASTNAKIVLSGEGADELFGGYECYVEGTRFADERLSKVRRLERIGLLPRDETIKAALYESQARSPKEYAERMLERIFWGRLQANHLELADRYFMASGVECRVPYLDQDLVSYIASLPLSYRIDLANGIQKVALKCLLAGHGPTLSLCSLRRKQGLPGAALQYAQRLSSQIVRYAPQFNTQLASKIRISGIRALTWDLFHAIFFDGGGSCPDMNLAHQLALDQGIELVTSCL